ncbi:MAG: hypothetical protein ACTSWM_00680 [Alphaproteobacteria bacterium]
MPTPPLYEKYRPTTLDQVAGQPQAVAQIRRAIEQDAVARRAWWISGRSGNGKTTLARILAESVADPLCIREYDGRDVTAATLRDILDSIRFRGFGRGGHAVIINEAHGLRDATRWLGILEDIPSHVVWIFTTTTDGQMRFDGMDDAAPFLSRCRRIRLQSRGVADAFARRAKEIAQAEGLDGRPLNAYKELVNQHRGNLRAVLQDIESGVMMDAE